MLNQCLKGILCSALTALLLSACAKEDQAAPQPPEVHVVTVRPKSVANIVEVPGRLQAVRMAEVRARVDGIVQKRTYDEGSDVKEDKELFLIDPREMQARLSGAEATLQRAEATAANAAQDVERYKGLVAEEAISKQEFDAAVARQRTALADVAQMRAEVAAARLNLNYTRVTAPIAGRAGRAQVTEGALVSASAGTLLTTIEQLDPIYVNFSQSSAELMAIRREIRAGTLKVPEFRRFKVHLELEDGTQYEKEGHLDFLDLSIDEATGTAAVRAEFPNPDRLLLPGQFVRARVEAGARPGGMLVPQRAVILNSQAAEVMVVGPDGKVAARPIKVGDLQGGSWVVLSGLKAGERVIIDGLQKIQPGMAVRVAAALPAKAQPGAAAAAP
ncbi:MAG: efflux RND transporter periplasmic adaptor subunit [Steroidobacteraceae bacterium]